MTSKYLLEASGTSEPVFILHQGGWVTVHKKWLFLKERLSAVYNTL